MYLNIIIEVLLLIQMLQNMIMLLCNRVVNSLVFLLKLIFVLFIVVFFKVFMVIMVILLGDVRFLQVLRNICLKVFFFNFCKNLIDFCLMYEIVEKGGSYIIIMKFVNVFCVCVCYFSFLEIKKFIEIFIIRIFCLICWIFYYF